MMQEILFNDTTALVIRIILGLLFLASGILKLPDLKGFFVIFVKFGIIKGKIAKFAAYSFPFIEIIVGAALLVNFYITISALVALLMLAVSTLGVIYALYSKKKIDNCGCYGTSFKVPIDKKKIIENSLFLVLNIYLLINVIQ